MPTEFRLRFPLSKVLFWADRYDYSNPFVDEADVEAIGERAHARGWYTRDEFLTVMLWKTPRTRSRCAMNTEAAVVSATRTALSTQDVHERMNALTSLHGVAFPTASVLLHFAHRDRFPILDFRALWSLGIDEPPTAYTFEFWSAYTRECRSLAEAAEVSMRTLDRALWQYSKEQQVPLGRVSLVAQAAELRRMPGQDRLRAVALGVVSAFPVIGPVLAEVLGNEVQAARERRLEDLLERIAEDIEEMRQDLDAHLADDTFTETVEAAVEAAMRSSEARRRSAYAALIVNSLTPSRPSEEERLFFLDMVGRSRTLHLRVLMVANQTTVAPEGFYAGSPISVLMPRLPGVDRDLVRLAWNDLWAWGMVNSDWSAMNATMTREGAGNVSARLTDVGRRFLRFVTMPSAQA